MSNLRISFLWITTGNNVVFSFRVKFYPADPTRVKEELTRFLMYLQLRRDLVKGRLQCSEADMAFLLACVVQSELGDYHPIDHAGNYVKDLNIIPSSANCEKIEETVTQLHQTDMKGQSPAEAELSFLRKASSLETYGIDPFAVKDHKGNAMNLGINHSGILVFQGNHLSSHYAWKEIQKITYEGRMFIIHIVVNDKKMLMGYKCPTSSAVHFVWRSAIEQKYFFTSSSSSEVPVITAAGGFFAKTVKVRYRCVCSLPETIVCTPGLAFTYHSLYCCCLPLFSCGLWLLVKNNPLAEESRENSSKTEVDESQASREVTRLHLRQRSLQQLLVEQVLWEDLREELCKQRMQMEVLMIVWTDPTTKIVSV